MISEKSFTNKHSVYYVDGIVAKTFDKMQRGLDEGKLIEKLDKKTGHRRYYDPKERKWLAVDWSKRNEF